MSAFPVISVETQTKTLRMFLLVYDDVFCQLVNVGN